MLIRFQPHLLALALLTLNYCTPNSSKTSSGARVTVRLEQKSLLKSTDAVTSLLPINLCYVLHANGAGMERMPADPSGCGPTNGLGMTSPNAYAVGDSAEIFVPIGYQRKFQLIGFESPRGIDATTGLALCGNFNIQIIPPLPGQNRNRIEAKMNGTVINSPFILFYEGLSDIAVGENVVTMTTVPLVLTPFTSAYSFGAPLNRQDIPGTATVGQCSEGNLRAINSTPMNSTGVSISAPIVNNGITLRFVTSVPVLMPLPKAAAEGSFTLKTGLAEAIHGE